MHRYSVHSERGHHVQLYLGVFAVGLAWAFSQTLVRFGITVPWWVDPPSVMGFYGVLYQLFDKVLWRTRLVRVIRLVAAPNLGGKWGGTVTSSFAEHAEELRATVEISQTWTHILIRFSTSTSTSESEAATIVCKPGSGSLLIYEYFSVPAAGSVDTMHAHRGTARLEIRQTDEGDLLDGEYYTGRDRQSYGRIKLSRSAQASAPARMSSGRRIVT